jgi:hypothetical protein
MTTVQRLKLAGALLSLAGAIICTQVWGDGSGRRETMQPTAGRTDAQELRLGERLVTDKFAESPIVSYRTTQGETIIAAQVKPALEAGPARPRDLAVLIDNSASQAGSAFNMARSVAGALKEALGPNDRVSIWVVSTPSATKCLTGNDFVSAKSDKLAEALNKLENSEYCSGATDLKDAIHKSLASFDLKASRQSAILLLGDGESAYSPVTNPERFQIGQELVSQKVAFFAIPLGTKLNPDNLHGFATTTGGAVVRLQRDETSAALCLRLLATISAPILYPTKFELADGIIEVLPSKLPPLRGDSPTLMVGKVKPGAESLSLSVEGTIAGKPARAEIKEKVSKPQNDNYFLVSMFQQWSKAPNKAAPALIRADRALAYAMQQTRLTMDEYITEGQWALSDNRLDVADKLFGLALKLDPNDFEAQNGKAVVQKLKEGKITRKALLNEIIAAKKGSATKISKEGQSTRTERVDLSNLLVKAEAEQDKQPSAPPEPDLLRQAQQQRALAEQQTATVVDETVRRAKALLNTDPDGAYDLLKRQRASVVDNPEIGERVKQSLLARLDAQLRDVDNRGRAIKQRLEEDAQRRIRAERDRVARAEAIGLQERTRERIRAFVSLMNQARYEEAYKESLVMMQENIAKGEPVPDEAVAAYAISLNAYTIREMQELKRLGQERFLLTMLQVDKSHMPYPDEPPVHFPPATVWKQLSEYRKAKYDASGLGPDTSPRTKQLSAQLSKVVDIEKAIEAPLKDVLDFLADRFDLTIIVDEVAFKNAETPLENVQDQRVKLPKLPGVTLSTVLRLVLSQIGGTYLVRRDYVEVTTAKEAIKEKTVRAYEVADLVIPIPSSINQLGLSQNLNVLGGAFSFGAAGSPFTQFTGIGGGGFGALGVGGFGALGLGGGLGALGAGGALGLGGGAAGMVGGGGLVGLMGFGGQGNNLGFGGGVGGFGGGQLGQFGNLGGQFGLQGGDQSALLINLITDVIARGEWARVPTYIQQQLGQAGMGDMGDDTPVIPQSELNSLGYYPPARALVVRATSRVHTRLGGGLLNPRAGGAGNMGMAPGQGRDGMLAFGGPKPKADDNNKGEGGAKLDPKREWEKGEPARKVTAKDWQAAFAKENIKDKAGWVIAIAHLLGEVKEWGQAAEVLKTNLRQGFVNDAWVFEALAIALQESNAAPDEVERAKLSCIDLDPKDPQAYLRAAHAMADLGQPERALSFCRQASALQPDLADPYSTALVYLEKSKTVDTDAAQWAVSNLLSRDWSADGETYRAQAHGALKMLTGRLTDANRKADAERLQCTLAAEKRRDLVIEMSYVGDADLDLRVIEPIGTTCSALNRQTPAGSTLLSDLAAAKVNSRGEKEYREVYTVSEAFNGTYEAKVDRVWGRPTSGRAMIKVIRHQGTPDQKVEYYTVNLDKPESVKIPLTGGRRSELAAVPPPAATGHPEREKVDSSADRAVNRLRALADPTYSGETTNLRGGGAGSAGQPLAAVYDLSGPKTTGHVSYQTKVEKLAKGSVDLTANAEIETNRKGETEIHVKMAPVFDTVRYTDEPTVINPLIPGGK